MRSAHTWAIVLAAGEGTRLRALTTDAEGRSTPKQFCSLRGGPTLLQQAIARAARLVPARRIVVIVAAQHRLWWERDLAALPRENVLAQPANRGTAAGILLPLLWILRRDPLARIVLFPSDHFVRREERLEAATRRALAAIEVLPRRIVLLGVQPESAEPGLGWILPARAGGGAAKRVEGFVEKPDPAIASELVAMGALINSFILGAQARFLAQRIEIGAPDLWRRAEAALAGEEGWSLEALEALYATLPDLDFSRAILERAARDEVLSYVPVPACGWSDLGTPERVMQTLGKWDAPQVPLTPAGSPRALDLSQSLLRAPLSA